MDLKICALASGSRGNSVLLKNGKSALLIDAGLSFRELKKRMKATDLHPEDISAVLVTHSHIDHSRGLKTLCEKSGISAYLHADGEEALAAFTRIERGLLRPSQSPFAAAGMDVSFVKVMHDVPCCTGFVIRAGGKKVCYLTDLGCADDAVLAAARECDLLFIESNHDEDMLRSGPYPYPLKKRILSKRGHLSNAACAEVVLSAVKSGTKRVILGHLSQQNNLPELAFHTVAGRLRAEGFSEGEDYFLSVASQDAPGPVIDI